MKRKNEAKWDEKQNRWYIQVQTNGIRKSFYSSKAGKKGKIESEKKADVWLEKTTRGEDTPVYALFDDFIKEMERFGMETTQYASIGRKRIIPAIGKKKIGAITEQDLQDIIHVANEDGLAKKTQKNIRSCCTAFIKYCRKRKCTTLVPIDLEVHKDASVPQKQTLQPDEIRKIFSSDKTTEHNHIIQDRYIYLYRFGITTGMRPSELIGLKWGGHRKRYGAYISWNQRKE